MTATTSKQMAFRDHLIRRALKGQAPTLSTGRQDAARAFLRTALLVSVPVPQTAAEASAQIDALQGDFGRIWANEQWAQAVVARCSLAVGRDGSGVATKAPQGWAWTDDEWAAYVKAAIV